MSGPPKARYLLRVGASRWRASWRVDEDNDADVVALAKIVAKGEPDKWVDVIDEAGRIVCRYEPRALADDNDDQLTLGGAS